MVFEVTKQMQTWHWSPNSRIIGLPLHTARVDTPEFAAQHGLCMEDAARSVRYRFFEQVTRQLDLNRVATGHTADDNAETVLMRMLTRGGTRGLRGIPPIREDLYIRPLLPISRKEIQAYARHRGLTYAEDSSNLQTGYLRNRIRHELIPLLETYNPNIRERLSNLAAIMRVDGGHLEQQAAALYGAMITEGAPTTLRLTRLCSIAVPLQIRVLQRAFHEASGGRTLEYPHIKALLRLAHSRAGSKYIQLPGDVRAARTYGELTFTPTHQMNHTDSGAVYLQLPGKTIWNNGTVIIQATTHPGPLPPSRDPHEGIIDYSRLTLPLRVRSFRPGDRFVPLGMQGKKKLKDFFIDAKVPRWKRHEIPLVVSGNDICWVAGLRIDDRYKVSPGTPRSVHLVMKRL
jgi:tRNA(Ile)-lysidine synthase